MTYLEVLTMLESTGLPVAYYAWREGSVPALPFLVYYYPSTDNFSADNRVHQVIQRLNVELYTENKDFQTEALVESALNQFGMFWDKSETYLDSEQMYLILYEMEVIIKNGE